MIRAINILFVCMFCVLGLEKAVAQSGKDDYYLKGTNIIVDGANGKKYEVQYDTIWTKKSPAMLSKSSEGSKMASLSLSSSSCTCNCLKPLFDYLITSQRLFTPLSDHIMLSSLIQDANNAGYNVSYSECPLLSRNINKYFYALTTEATATVYKARIGDCTVLLKSINSNPVTFSELTSGECNNGKVSFIKGDVINKTFYATRTVNVIDVDRSVILPLGERLDSLTTRITAADQYNFTNLNQVEDYRMRSYFKFDSLLSIPSTATILSARLKLFADEGGTIHPSISTAHAPSHIYQFGLPNRFWDSTWTAADFFSIPNWYVRPNGQVTINDPFENLDLDVKDWFPSPFLLPQKGIQLMVYQRDFNVLQYITFYSQRYPNIAKQPRVEVSYSLEINAGLAAELQVDTCYTCTPVPSGICYSAVTDTSVNPFMYGIAGNWRAYRSYAYYGTRAETDPAQATNIRKDGTFNDFASFWNQVSGSLKAQPDTNKWVWNSETTLFNRRGIELENKDPLGRYNAGLYGYDDALPVAVIQNSRFRESAFDGFEDYYFGNNICDTACAGSRNFDFSAYKNNLDTTQQHTGRYSLKVTAGNSAGISAKMVAGDDNAFGLSFNKAADNCPTGGDILKSVRANADVLLPTFSPLSGKKVVVSAWAKESQDCNGTSYTSNQIGIVVEQGSTSTTVIAKPTGNIIEGWQRYEQVVELPAGATMISINLQATGSADVYFDDVRIHPYNANMKSFVYNPVNLRLMSELDENNYATFYEYDDDGALIRLKKETSRGIKTIRETRNGLLKEETPD